MLTKKEFYGITEVFMWCIVLGREQQSLVVWVDVFVWQMKGELKGHKDPALKRQNVLAVQSEDLLHLLKTDRATGWSRWYDSGQGGTTVVKEVRQWSRRYDSGQGGTTVVKEVRQWSRRYDSGQGGTTVDLTR